MDGDDHYVNETSVVVWIRSGLKLRSGFHINSKCNGHIFINTLFLLLLANPQDNCSRNQLSRPEVRGITDELSSWK